jgi:uncharacterized membrane protein
MVLATTLTSTALGACGGDGNGGTAPQPTPTLAISLASAAMTATQGESKTATVTLTRGGGYAGPVAMAVTGAPSGLNVTFTPADAGATTSTMTVAVFANATPGTYPLVVRGVGTGVAEATAPLTVTVNAAAAPTIGLASDLAAVAVPAGAGRTGALAVSRGGGYAGAVELTASVVGDTPGLSAEVNPATLAAGTGNGVASVTVNAAASAARGAATVRLTATGAGVAPASVDLPVQVLVPAVAVTAPAATNIAQGGAGTAAVAFSRTDFTGEVTISVENPPAGVTATTVTVPEGQSSGVLNLNVAAGATAGERPLTVRVAGPGGSPSATTTLPLTVTAAPAVTLAVAPSPLAVTAGGNAAAATVSLARTNFAGGVTLTAAGAPAGLSVTVPAAAVTTNSATVDVQAGAGVAAGDYSVTLTGAAQGIANATASLVVRVAGAGNGGGDGGGSTVRLTFCESDAPIWVAAQNGDGAWTRLAEVAPRQYDVTVGQRAGLATVTREGTGYETDVHYLSAAEVAGMAQGGCVEPAAGSKTVQGSVAGLGDGSRAMASLGSGFGIAVQNGPFAIMNVPDGAQTLVATRTAADELVDRVILRRGINAPAGSVLPVLDFGSAEAFAPTSAAISVQNLGTDVASVTSALYTGTFGGGLLSNTRGTTGLRFLGVPAAKLGAGEFNTVTVMAGAANGSGPQRLVVTFLGEISDAAVALAAPLSTPLVSAAATAPYLRPQLQMAGQADYNAYATASFTQDGGAAFYRSATVSRTAAYGGGAPATWALGVPDFSGVAGFDPAWGLRADATYAWNASAYGGSLVAVLGVAPTVGTSFRYASRSGGSLAQAPSARAAAASPAARAQATAARLAGMALVGRP